MNIMNQSNLSLNLSNEIEDESFETPWTIKDFVIGKKLGRGRFGRVYLAKEKRTSAGLLVALKILAKEMLEKTDTLENFKRETENQLTFKHPHVLACYGWFHDDLNIYLILEYAPNGNLFKKLQKRGTLDNHEAATIIYQTAKGLLHIHSKGVVHRDLKPENILLGYWDEVKIADFGWCNKTNLTSDSETYEKNASVAGTIDYLCPEIILQMGHTHKVDIWCLGILCYEMLVGKAPFYEKSTDETIDRILKVNYSLPPGVNRHARNLITQLIVKNPEKRISLTQVLHDQWINCFADKNELNSEYN